MLGHVHQEVPLNIRLFFLGLLITLAFACERSPDTSNPSSFEGEAVKFEYPGNWTVEDQSTEKNGHVTIRSLTVNSPGDAIAVFTMIHPIDAMTLEGFAEEAITVREEEIKRLMGKAEGLAKVSKTRVTTAPTSIEGSVGPRIRHDFAISMVGEEVPHWGDFHRFSGETWDVFVYTQATHEDWDTVNPGFQQILTSISPR